MSLSVVLPDADIVLYEKWVMLDEADQWMSALIEQTPWEQPEVFIHGRHHPVPRLVAWYGDPEVNYGYSGLDHFSLPWTKLLDDIRNRICDFCGQPFNGVLVNYYRDGRDSMGWHSDNETILGTQPT